MKTNFIIAVKVACLLVLLFAWVIGICGVDFFMEIGYGWLGFLLIVAPISLMAWLGVNGYWNDVIIWLDRILGMSEKE